MVTRLAARLLFLDGPRLGNLHPVSHLRAADARRPPPRGCMACAPRACVRGLARFPMMPTLQMRAPTVFSLTVCVFARFTRANQNLST